MNNEILALLPQFQKCNVHDSKPENDGQMMPIPIDCCEKHDMQSDQISSNSIMTPLMSNNTLFGYRHCFTKLTETDRAMAKHMVYINRIECRPFSYKDFQIFDVDGRYYCVPHGTCRNKFSQFVKNGIIEIEYKSNVTFYKLKGFHFGNRSLMTPNHMGISSVIPVTGVIGIGMQDLFDYLHTVPIDQPSVHDIHFKFKVTGIYKIFSSNSKYSKLIKPVSYDIILSSEIIDGLKITPIIHRTDTVTVSVACSATPIPITEEGITNLSCALTRAEERLSVKLNECGNSLTGGYERILITDNRRWIVTMWHFGRDRKYEYKKDGYSLTWGYGREVLRIYTKSIKGQHVQRNDRQEYPNKPFADAVKEKSY